MANAEELARFISAHVASVVLEDERVLTNRRFVESIDTADLRFDPEAARRQYESCRDSTEIYEWSFDPFVMAPFRADPVSDREAADGDRLVAAGGGESR